MKGQVGGAVDDIIEAIARWLHHEMGKKGSSYGAKTAGRAGTYRHGLQLPMLSCTDGRSEQWPTAATNLVGGGQEQTNSRSCEHS
jgi:hypothetical protein